MGNMFTTNTQKWFAWWSLFTGKQRSCSLMGKDLLAFTGFPRALWRKTWSTNPLERLHREIKGRTEVVGVFPNPEALLRRTTAVLMDHPTNGQPATAATFPKEA